MTLIFLAVGSVCTVLAALIHVVIFVLESVLWGRPAVWQRFGVASDAQAQTIRPMAFNQGFYNLFLAGGGFIGVILIASPGLGQAGAALCLFAVLSMLLAAVVLITSNPKLARAAFVQGTLPLFATIFLALGVLLPNA
jgi:putative membrane protein